MNGIVKPTTDLMAPLLPSLLTVQPTIASNLARWEEIIAQKGKEAASSEEITRLKIAELSIPNSESQRKSLSFVMYNCSGKKPDSGERPRT